MGQLAEFIRQGTTENVISGQKNTAEALRKVYGFVADAVEALELLQRGFKLFINDVAPDNAGGLEGDAFINTATGDFYVKIDGQWALQLGMKGADGVTPVKGTDYVDGVTPVKGTDYFDGADGKSAYQLWLDEGNVGTLAEFLESLHGTDGTDGQPGASLLDGPGEPLNSQGNEGDYYDQHDGRVWKKVAGAWVERYTRSGGTGGTGGTDVNITSWNALEKASVLDNDNWNGYGYYTPGPLTLTGPYAYLVKPATVSTYGYEYRTLPNPAGAGVIVTRTQFV
jgi:hypothetical protein